MLLYDVTHVSLDSFRQRSAGKKLVLLYPWTNYRNLFLAYFLANASEGFLYYRLKEEEAALDQWLAALLAEFQSVLGDFGQHLQTALSSKNPDTLAAALAADLESYSDQPLILFLDELDRAKMDTNFEQFMRSLINLLPANAQVAVSSRLLSYQPWYDMVVSSEAIVLGTAQRRDDMMFTVENTPKPQLEVYAFGRGHALVNGRPITNWDGALPRNLFFFFMDHPLVTRDEIFETFWQNLSVKDATNVFHVTKRKITERLSMKVTGDANYELTQYNSGFYMPSDKLVRHYDVSDFQEAMDKALVASSDKEEAALLTRAIDLYKGSFLQTIKMDWVEERRKVLRDLYTQALIGMGRIHQRQGDEHRALGFFTRALKETPEREDIHRQVMELYQAQGLLDDAIIQYRKLEQVLRETLKIAPSRETRDLYEQIDAKRR